MRIAALRRDPSGKPKGVVIVAIILSAARASIDQAIAMIASTNWPTDKDYDQT